MKILVTSYINPDLDGAACMYGYAEFLNKTGSVAVAAVSGEVLTEARFVFNKFNITPLEQVNIVLGKVDKVIIVDVSESGHLSEDIEIEKVVEVIDHRKINESDKFLNAKVQIELVGSASTLIAEKFYNDKIDISKEAAALLYSAIVSNTINFKANVTTDRDKKMAEWLMVKFSLPENYTRDMFAEKSDPEVLLNKTFIDDCAIFNFDHIHLGIAQLEMINVDNFIRDNLSKIREILAKIKKDNSLEYVFLTCIDLEKAFNRFVVIDDKMRKIVEEALRVEFKGGIAKKDGILMRKEIVPLIKEIL